MKESMFAIDYQTRQAAEELIQTAGLAAGDILVVGCSTSEVRGKIIGSAGSDEIAVLILDGLMKACHPRNLNLAVQCCEHLNRALVVERQTMYEYGLEEVKVIPVPKAGGALAARAMRVFTDPVVVETVRAHAGIDIGCTLIGMHLRQVAVPVRLSCNYIGHALVTAARTRPKLIGGARAVYEVIPAE